VPGGELLVRRGVAHDVGVLRVGDRTPDPAGDAGDERARRDDRALEHDGAGRHERARTDDGAERCDRVLASDGSVTAARLAAERCATLPVSVSHRALPAGPVDEAFSPDLVLLSEVVYYLSDEVRADTVALVDQRGATDCELVVVHWDGAPHDAWLSGRGGQTEVVAQLVARGWTQRVHHEDDGFLLDTVTRGSA
jgi:hypothetical protein